MFDTHSLNLSKYTPVGDITVMALCIIMGILVYQTYIHKNRNFRMILGILASIFVAAMTDIIYEVFLNSAEVRKLPIYFFRSTHHIILSAVLFLYISYLRGPLWIPSRSQQQYTWHSAAVLTAAIAVDIIGTVMKLPIGFYISDLGEIHTGLNVYGLVFGMFALTIFHMIIRYRSRLIKQVFVGLMGVNITSVLILALQGFHSQVSYTVAAYFFPIIGIIFMLHSNPYDTATGAISGKFYALQLKDSINRGSQLIIFCCWISGFYENIDKNKEFKYEYHRFFRHNVRKGVLYSFADDRLVLTIEKEKNRDYEKLIHRMIQDFLQSYSNFGLDYKLVIMETSDHISDTNDYDRMIAMAEKKLSFNEICRIGEEQIEEYYNSVYILSQLEDIAAKKDVSDPRVQVYCQPVYNLITGTYDTAEALTRLKLEKTGMVPPDKFISLAEEHGLIHQLSCIILHKTCFAIRDLMEDGFEIRRISVNFSMLELRHETFFTDIKQIIDRNGIPYSKIAVEITESRSDADFHIMKHRVKQLQELGIMFYLDDFGTGYSNFERIMEIPFDIIKFDRTMLIESRKSAESHYMVSTFAGMFKKLDYTILFEGVETDSDEESCLTMNAKYLQGYKYSKPIPIAELRKFLHPAVI